MSDEKMKLMTLTENAWHFRLIKFVFGKIIPDPTVIFNGCAYFWVTIGALIVLPFLSIFKLIAYPFKLMNKLFKSFIYNLYEASITSSINKKQFKYLYNSEYNYTGYGLINKLLYGKSYSIQTHNELLRKKLTAAGYIDESIDTNYQMYNELYRLHHANKVNQDREDVYIPKSPSKISKWLDSAAKITPTMSSFKKISLIPKNYGKIVLYTQRFVALLITLLVGFFTISITSLITSGIAWIYLIWDSAAILSVLINVGLILSGGITGVAIVFLLVYSISKLSHYLNNKKPTWYTKLILGLILIYKWTLEYPFKFLILVIIWKWIIYQCLWGIIRGFISAIIIAYSIFAEYFSFEYKAFCPGIEWVKKETKK